MGGVMNHRSAAKAHYRERCIKRYGRAPDVRDMDRHRLALKYGTAWMCKDCGDTIKGVVKLGNIYITAVYDKELDGMITAGVSL